MKTAQGFKRTEGKKAGMPLGRAGLGSAPAEFQMMPPLPSPGGKLAAERPLAELQEDPRVSVSSLVTGLDTQQGQNIKAATECCVSLGSFHRPPRWPLPIWGYIHHIYFIQSSWGSPFRVSLAEDSSACQAANFPTG